MTPCTRALPIRVTRPVLKALLVVSMALGSHGALATTTVAKADTASTDIASTDAMTTDQQVDQLTQLVAQAFPIDYAFTQLKAQMPTWPFQAHPDAVTAEQLSCVRQELNTDNYIQQLRGDVQSYVDSHPDKVAADIALMKNAAPLWAAAMKAGMSDPENAAIDKKKILSDSTPQQLLAFISLFQDANNEDLRKLIGINGLQLDAQHSGAKQVGKDAAMKKMLPLFLKSMATCNVPMKSLF